MKKRLITAGVALSLVFAFAAFADKGAAVYKAGETVYACACGEACKCDTMGRKAGDCSCGKAMAKSVVDRVEGDKAYVKVNGKERAFMAKAKYACDCGEACTCGYISQKPGKCACGKEMKEVN